MFPEPFLEILASIPRASPERGSIVVPGAIHGALSIELSGAARVRLTLFPGRFL